MAPGETTIHGGHKQAEAFTSHAESARATAAAAATADADTADDRRGTRQQNYYQTMDAAKATKSAAIKVSFRLRFLALDFFVLRTTPHLGAMIYESGVLWPAY